jgi:hypothetical protein
MQRDRLLNLHQEGEDSLEEEDLKAVVDTKVPLQVDIKVRIKEITDEDLEGDNHRSPITIYRISSIILPCKTINMQDFGLEWELQFSIHLYSVLVVL